MNFGTGTVPGRALRNPPRPSAVKIKDATGRCSGRARPASTAFGRKIPHAQHALGGRRSSGGEFAGSVKIRLVIRDGSFVFFVFFVVNCLDTDPDPDFHVTRNTQHEISLALALRAHG
jgi:hypothetical protein